MRQIAKLCSFALMLIAATTAVADTNPQVTLHTNKGAVTLELYPDRAPKTVANFLRYVDNGFYDGLIFHRVIPNFMIQGGGFKPDMSKLPTEAPIANEADNGLKNLTGTIAMARTGDPHSATAQFFINTKDNHFLDHSAKTSRGWGYAVFGKVTQGMEVVRQIEASPTTSVAGYRDVPRSAVIIERAEQLAPAAE